MTARHRTDRIPRNEGFTHMHIRRALMGTAAIGTMLSSTAFAQIAGDVDDDPRFEDEIIVTATKREQTLQEVPVAVTVTPADTIEKAQILDINDLQSVVPSLRVSQNQNSQQTTFSIRGFGNGGNNIGIEPSVGVFIDGVYRSRAAAQIGDLPALERVEVLRGPQSTLFGKNSSAGVISIVTREPEFDSNGYIEAGVSNYSGFNGRAYMTGAISENVAASLGGGFNFRDGYADSVFDNLESVNDRDRWNIRGQLLFEPTDDVSFRLIGDYNKINENCCHVTNFINGPTAGLIQGLGGLIADPQDPFAYLDYSDTPKSNDIDDYGLSFQADAALSDSIDLVSITSVRQNESFYDSEVDYTSARLVDSVAQDSEITTFTQELRLQGTEDRFAWLLGGYYFYEDIEVTGSLDFGADFRPYAGALAALGGGPVANPFAAGEATLSGIEAALGLPTGTFFQAGNATGERFTQSNDSFSVFANVDFDVTDRFTLTLGGSYIDDAKDVTFQQVANNDVFSQLNFAGADGARIITGQGFQGALPGAFLDTFGIAFTPANVAAVTSTPQGAAGFQQLQAGVLAAVQAQVAQLNLLDPAQNPLLGLTALQFLPPIPAFPNAVESGRSRDDKFTYTVRGAFDVTDDINVYAAYSTGFKATSFNLSRDTRPTVADFPALDQAGILPDITAVALTRAQLAAGAPFGPYTGTRFAGPEDSSVIEVGVKGRIDTSFFTGGNFALTLFQQDIDDFQANVFQGAGFALLNAGEQRTRGVEFEAGVTPLEGLTLGGSLTYLDAEYKEFIGAPGLNGPFDASGQEVDGVSPWNFVVAAQYDREFGDNMEGFIRTDFSFESETDAALNTPGAEGENSVFGMVPVDGTNGLIPLTRETKQWNAAAGFGFDNGISIEAWVRNILDDEDIQVTFPGVVQAGTFNGYPNAPRTYGANLRYEF